MNSDYILEKVGLDNSFLTEDFWSRVYQNDYSPTYQMTSLDLYNLSKDDLSVIRSEHEEFKNKLSQLTLDEFTSLRNDLWSLVASACPRCLPFGWIKRGDTGSISRMLYVYYCTFFGKFPTGLEMKSLESKLARPELYLGNDHRICEIGTSIGAWTSSFFFANTTMPFKLNPGAFYGCDLMPEFSQFLAILGANTYISNLAKDRPFEVFNDKFDLVIMTEVIEHIVDQDTGLKLLENTIECIKSGGDILISYPVDVGTCHTIEEKPLHHHHQPDPEKIESFLSDKFEECTSSILNDKTYYHFCKRLIK